MSVKLPVASGKTEFYVLHPPSPFPRIHPPVSARTAFAAAHVVADPLALSNPWQEPAVDWEATFAFRRHLWGLGLKVAEAMDTPQRGVGLDWRLAVDWIRGRLAKGKQ